MSAPVTLSSDRVAELTAELVGCAEDWPYKRRTVATLTNGELRSLLHSHARLVEAEQLLRDVNQGVLWSKAMDGWHCPRCGTVEGHSDDCIHGRIDAFLSPATAEEQR